MMATSLPNMTVTGWPNSFQPQSPVSSVRTHLPVAPERKGVLALPGLSASSLGVVVSVALVDTTVVLASTGKTTEFAVLVDWVGDPVDASITADGLVLWVDKDDLEVLVGRVLVDPVGVEDAQVGAAATDTLLSNRAKTTLELELVDTLVGWLAWPKYQYINPSSLFQARRTVGGTLWSHPLATTTADSDAVDNVSLLGLVTETASLVWTGWARCAVDNVQLTELD